MSLRALFSRRSFPQSPNSLDDENAELALTDDCRALVAGYNAMGLAMLDRLASDNGQGNTLISPLSIALSLMMVGFGAKGNTRDEMARLLGVARLSDGAVDEASRVLSASLRAASDVELRVANSLWVNQNIQLAPAFEQRCEQSFEARVATLSFGPQAVDRINDWVGAHTNGKIDRIIEKLDPLDFLVLINAVYFRGDWLEPFAKSATKPEIFHGPAGRASIPMMTRRDDFRYLENAMFQAVALPYGGERFALYALLPRPASDVRELLGWMKPRDLEATIAKMKSTAGRVSLPRFKMSYGVQLNDCLQQLGMRDAFDVARADFAPMSATALHVGDVVHKTVLELDETGTQAAAVTSAQMVGRMAAPEPAKPFEFVANRPFALILRDDWSGALLFAGVVNAPE